MLASAERVIFNQIHARILVGDMSDQTEEYLDEQTRQLLGNIELRGTLCLSLCHDRNTLDTVWLKRIVSA